MLEPIKEKLNNNAHITIMPVTTCPNCGHEFLVDKDTYYGKCPKCGILLYFKYDDEKIEKVDIKNIEKEIDSIKKDVKQDYILFEEIPENEGIEKKVDKLINNL